MSRKRMRKLLNEFLVDQEKKRKEESEQVNLKEEAFKPLTDIKEKMTTKMMLSPYKKHFLTFFLIVFSVIVILGALIFVSDSKDAYKNIFRPEEEQQQEEAILNTEKMVKQLLQVVEEREELEKKYELLEEEHNSLKKVHHSLEDEHEALKKEYEALKKQKSNGSSQK